ncbi:hypothetical protein HQ43_07780 [Porphyromonas canoris]|uniref:Uncharacterized protein n=1 Tax=Porphyromonas canoris TaxID=36875 RepID=A0ABR4XKG2_9PORP|nr:hypothetical protein HQ43_07780 [Porphyromonas canoris]
MHFQEDFFIWNCLQSRVLNFRVINSKKAHGFDREEKFFKDGLVLYPVVYEKIIGIFESRQMKMLSKREEKER